MSSYLERKGIETFLPLLKEMHQWTDRAKKIETPLFPGYTFARIHAGSRSRIDLLRTEGVIGVIGFAGKAVSIPAKQIDDLQLVLSQKVPCALHPFLRIGQRVRIRGGSLDGLEGILDRRGERSLVISVESIERSVAIRIEGYELELI